MLLDMATWSSLTRGVRPSRVPAVDEGDAGVDEVKAAEQLFDLGLLALALMGMPLEL